MGDVYRATDTQLGRTVAIKVLAIGTPTTSRCVSGQREALAAARFGSPNIITIFDVGESDGHLHRHGAARGSLEDRLRAGGAQDPADASAGSTRRRGARRGARRRRCPPRREAGNLLLNDRGEVSVADFGVASAVGLDSMTMTGTVLGTAGYLSPEQAKGGALRLRQRPVRSASAYELLTGERPFASESATAEAAVTSMRRSRIPVSTATCRQSSTRCSGAPWPGDAERARPTSSGDARGAPRTRHDAVQEEEYAPAAAAAADEPAGLGGCGDPRTAGARRGTGMAGVLGGDEEPQTRTVVETQVTMEAGQPTTVRETVTTAPATTSEPTSETTASDASGEELTDQATALGQGRWAEAEAVSRQALAELEGSGALYEAYANYNLGRAPVEQGRCDEALPHLDRSEADPGQPQGDSPGAQALHLTHRSVAADPAPPKLPAMRILVTGAAGFIGSNFVHYWLDRHPEDDVIALDLLTYAGNRANLDDVEDRITFVEGDIADPDLGRRLFEDQGAEVVVNFAAESHNKRRRPGALLPHERDRNPDAARRARQAGTVKRFHHVSTCEVYGDLALDTDEVFTEDSPYEPRTPYNASKAAADHAVRAYHETYGSRSRSRTARTTTGPSSSRRK